MARKLRLEFPGAFYHVINRGSFGADVFKTGAAQEAFEQCLFEACAKSRWVLHAFVIMRNHYHLALETPEGNLAAGMQWLQTTFANRFSRRRGKSRHLFQGRYKALLVEPGAALGQVCHSIHLNPVRVGAVTVQRLADFRPSSYWYLQQPRLRPGFLQVDTALAEAGGLADTAAGRRRYADFLAWQAAEGPAGRNRAYVQMSKGWVLGTKEFKMALRKDHARAAEARAWASEGLRKTRERRWAKALAAEMAKRGKTAADARRDRKGVAWKVEVARRLKETTQAGNRWLAERLNMGRPEAVSAYVGRLRAGERARPKAT